MTPTTFRSSIARSRLTSDWRRRSAARARTCTAPALIRDLFWSFHKRAPRINENMALKPAFAVNRRILEEIMGTAEWRQLREAGSINDPMISAIATIGPVNGRSRRSIQTRAVRSIDWPRPMKPPKSCSVRPMSLMNSPHRPRRNRSKISANARRKRARTPGARSGPPKLEESLGADDDERNRAIRQAARQGMAEALDEADAIQNAIAAFGGGYSTSNGGSGTPREMTARRRSNSPCASCARRSSN